MGIKDFFKNLVLKLDILSAQTMLRVNQNSDYQTYTGGIISIIVLILFSIIFYSSFLSVVGKMDITYTQTFEDDPTSQTQIKSIVMALGVSGVDFSAAGLRKLKVSLMQTKMMNPGQISTPVSLSVCNISDWAPLGNNFDKQFNGFKFNQMLCITKNQAYSIYGYSGTLPYQFMSLRIALCDGTAGCDTAANSLNWLTTQVTAANYVHVRLFLVDTIVSPSKAKPISSIIEKNVIVTFSQTTGTVGYAYFGDYTVQTDTSILPYTAYETLTGTFLDTFTTTTVPISNPGTASLVQFAFYKSTKSLSIVRAFGKVDDFLSYVGGLFSLLFSVIAFFFASYSQYSYELHIGEQCFSLDKSGKKFKQSEFNFFRYLKYCLFDWLGGFGISPNWQRDIKTKQVLNEANNIMSIPLILKRIKHLQNVSQILLEEHKLMGLYLANPLTLQEAQKMRQKFNFYDQIVSRLEQNRHGQIQSLSKVHGQSGVNETSFNNQLQLSKQDPLFDEQTEIDRQFASALRELKNKDDEQSTKIKQKILFQILSRPHEDKQKLKKQSIDSTLFKLQFENI